MSSQAKVTYLTLHVAAGIGVDDEQLDDLACELGRIRAWTVLSSTVAIHDATWSAGKK